MKTRFLFEGLHRVAVAAATLWVLMAACFFCLYLLPGDPARMILGPQASAASVAQFRREQGLDQPLPVQFGRFMARTAVLDLGYSFVARRPVASVVAQRSVATLGLAASALGVALAIGAAAPLAFAVARRRRWMDAFSTIIQALAYAPPYLLALGALLLATAGLGLAPVVFDETRPSSWILAACVLAIYPAALVMRVLQQGLDDHLSLTYALNARARGTPHAQLIWREVLPNVAPTVAATLANSLVYFVTNSFFIEAALGVGGLGRLAQDAIRQKDLATLSGVCLAYAIMALLAGGLLNLFSRRHAVTIGGRV